MDCMDPFLSWCDQEIACSSARARRYRSRFRHRLMFVAGYLIAASADNAFSLLMLNIPLAFVQIFGLGKPLARYLERLRSHDWVLRLTSTLRLRLFRVMQHQQREQAHWRTGDVLGSLASDIEHVQNLFLRCVFPVLIAWIVGVLLVAVAGFMSPGLLLFALIAFLLLCVIIPALAVVLNRARIERNDRTRASLYAEVTDKVLGSRDIAIAGRGGEITASSWKSSIAWMQGRGPSRITIVCVCCSSRCSCSASSLS